MLIPYLMKDIDSPVSWWFIYISVHLLLILYFVKVHPFIFKNRAFNDVRAFALGVVGVGLGQAYNGQLVKSIVFFTAFSILIFYGQVIDPNSDVVKYIAFGLLFLSAIEAGRSTKKAARTAVIDKRRKEVEKKAKVILDYKNMNHEFAVDTNILMHEPDMLLYLLAKSNLRLFMSMVVFTELDGLKKSENVVTRTQAQTAFDVIEEFQRRGNLQLLQVPKNDELRKYGLGSSPDEKIIGTYLWERERNHPSLLFISNDKGARILARNAGMPIVEF